MSVTPSDLTRRSLAEAIGSFILLFCGTGAIVINDASQGAITHVGVALTFGLVVLALIYALGYISGCHINPAVSIGLCVAGKFPGKELAPYIISQVTGALTASILIRLMFSEHPTLGATLPSQSPMQAFILELVLSWILMLVILCVSNGPRNHESLAGVAIGAVIGLEAMFAGPISGASMNPARSLAPAIVSLHLEHLWVYLSAPILGAIAGAWCFSVLRTPTPIADQSTK